MRRASLLVLAVVVLGGCGGEERLTRAEFASKADAICSKYNQQTNALQNPTNLTQLANVADQTLAILDNAIEELRKLEPPKSDQAKVDQWLAEVAKLRIDLVEIRDKARANDMEGVQAVVPRADRHNRQSNELATQLGMKVCSEG